MNANVALRAEPRVWDDKRWPQVLHDDRDGLDAAYGHAEEMLRPVPYPENLTPLKKLTALEACASYLRGPFYRPPINVVFHDGVNHVGVYQQACRLLFATLATRSRIWEVPSVKLPTCVTDVRYGLPGARPTPWRTGAA